MQGYIFLRTPPSLGGLNKIRKNVKCQLRKKKGKEKRSQMEQRFKKGGDNLHSPITQTSLLDKPLSLTNVIV